MILIKQHRKVFALVFLILNLVFLSVYFYFINSFKLENYYPMEKALNLMVEYSSILKDYRKELGIPLDERNDPNLTGLIGEEYNEITTTIGHLESKRTSTNPNMAALMVTFFQKLGLKAGDNVAIGSSGSFPAFLIAVVSACEAMKINPITIISAGASQWGANIPDFTLIDMVKRLQDKGYKNFIPAAVSSGGENDTGKDLMDNGQETLKETVFNSGYKVIFQEDFERNIQERMEIYFKNSNNKIDAFVNIGGASANTGKGVLMLDLKPGINEIKKFPSPSETGVIFEMAKKGVPVIHLLYIKGLSIQYGVDFDPVPLPLSLDPDLCSDRTKTAPKIKIILLAYFIILVLTITTFLIKSKKKIIK